MTASTPPGDRRSRPPLYDRLPAVYRLRDPREGPPDAPAGQPLRALLEVLQEAVVRLEDDVERLHDDWFIETCQPWIIPYIGDLVRARVLHPTTATTANLRAFVANTLLFRQRKGTAAVLEQLALDVTGWPARALELFQNVITTQHLNHVRLDRSGTTSVRDIEALAQIDTAFDTSCHTGEVRHIANGRGRYNLPHVGLFLWRLEAFPSTEARPAPGAAAVSSSSSSSAAPVGVPLLRFHPLGFDVPLFSPYRAEVSLETLSRVSDLPAPLRRRRLHDALERLRAARAAGSDAPGDDFRDQPCFRLWVGGHEILPEHVEICDLGDDRGPPQPGFEAQVDPERGRFVLADGIDPSEVRVSYFTGFSGELGGGEYDRGSRLPSPEHAQTYPVSGGGAALDAALAAYAKAPAPVAVVEIEDNETYVLMSPLTVDGGVLVIRAANKRRPTLIVDSSLGDWVWQVGGGASLTLSGVLVGASRLTLDVRDEARIALSDVTLASPAGDGRHPAPVLATTGSPAASLSLELRRSITGPVLLGRRRAGMHATIPPTSWPVTEGRLDASVDIEDAIVDGGGAAPAIEATTARVVAATVIGLTDTTVLDASDALFTGRVDCDRSQEGCVQFSYVPLGSRTPRRHRCEPDTAIADRPRDAELLRAAIVPVFTGVTLDHPGYGQVASTCPDEIRRGAHDAGEVGAFHFLQQPQREANLHASLEEYLRFGLEAGLVYVT